MPWLVFLSGWRAGHSASEGMNLKFMGLKLDFAILYYVETT